MLGEYRVGGKDAPVANRGRMAEKKLPGINATTPLPLAHIPLHPWPRHSSGTCVNKDVQSTGGDNRTSHGRGRFESDWDILRINPV